MTDLKSNPDTAGLDRLGKYRRLVAGLVAFLGVVAASLVAIWLLSEDARREIDKLAVANADSTQWSLAQFEVEFLLYHNALLNARQDGAGLADVRRRFDIFYSRAQIVKNSANFRDVVAIPEIGAAMGRVNGLLDAAVPVIDGGDEALRSGIEGLIDRVLAVQPDIRAISLAGVDVFAGRSEAQRENVARALVDLGKLAFALLLGLLAVVAVLMFVSGAARRRNAELGLTQSRLQAIVSTSIDAVLVIDRKARVLDYNGAAERIFGYSRQEALGADMSALIIPDHLRAAHDAGMKRYRETGQKKVTGAGLLQLEARRKDGSTFPVEFSINSADSPEGEVFVSYLRDISERVASETELVEARDRAVAGEKAKADLLAVMSHEMRTPLNGVLGTLQLLADTDLDPRQRAFVDVMNTSGQTLLDHVNNVLDISRLDAGKARPNTRTFALPALVNNIADSLRGQADLRGNALTVTLHGAIADKVMGDEPRLRQILFNLLGNAIKFTEHGTITIEVEREPGSDTYEFRVIDTGVGIEEADFERIFEDFVTLDASYRRAVEGTGLGLGITRRLVHLLGGEIGVESEIGDGSVFWFRLPLPAAQQAATVAPQKQDAQPDAPRRSVLVVEDNEINRMVVREMLLRQNCEVTEARDGQEGVETAGLRPFDLILMDISMPKMDGTAASQMIRSGTGPNRETPIVALTAHALPDDIARFRETGMDDVLTKPLSRDRLVTVLSDLCDAPRPGAEAEEDDLEAILGAEQTVIVRQQALAELSAGLARLEALQAQGGAGEAIGQLAHKMAGTAAVVGFAAIHAELAALETLGSTGTVPKIGAAIGRVRGLLSEKGAS
ncbi:MAG: response regulator [Roseivivax sp.]|nr:response regulator [Roseivivax sp.]